jgi:hypothetical protein
MSPALLDKIKGVGIGSLVIIVILASLFIAGVFDSCSDRKTETTLTQVELNRALRNQADSLQIEYAKLEREKIAFVQRAADGRIKTLKKENGRLKRLIDDQVGYYESDTVFQTETCDSIIQLYSQYSDSLRSEIVQHEAKFAATDSLLILERSESARYKSMYEWSESDNLKLAEQLARKNTWWRRNEKWVYFGVGFVSSKLLLK